MNCPNCHTPNPADARFCMQCGRPLPRVCASCGAVLPDGARFCMQCGEPMRVRTPADEARQARLRAAAPAPLAAKARAALTGERRVITVLFLDVVGSTALADELDLETWTSLLNEAFDRLTPIIYRYEGTIARLLGDSLVAFFGAPVAHEDDPQRAAQAALEIMREAQQYREEMAERHGVNFQMRACLNTGPVVVESVGNNLEYQYTAVGGTVNLAARLKFAAAPLQVVATEETTRFIGPYFDLRDLGEVEVTGRRRPVRIFEVGSRKAQPERSRGLAGLSSIMVGRDRELQQLLDLAVAVRAGVGRGVVVLGEPGLGKSRLIEEWQAAVQAEDPDVVWAMGQSRSYGQTLAYHLLVNLLHGLIGVPEHAEDEALEQALRRCVNRHLDREADEYYPYLAQLLGLSLSAEEAALVGRYDDPQTRQALYRRATEALLLAMADRGPLFVVLEDLHWADAASTTVLTSLLPLVNVAPILFTLVSRPEQEAPGWELVTNARQQLGNNLQEISLNALGEADSRQLVSNLLAIDAIPDSLRRLILAKSEGNPFFVEEVIRMLVDRRAIIQQDGGWVAGRPLDELEIPDNLEGLLRARIDRLPDDVKDVLRVAAVIGRQFPLNVLADVLGEPPP